MQSTRIRNADEIFNILTNLPDQFLKIYKDISPATYQEMCLLKDKTGRYFLQILAEKDFDYKGIILLVLQGLNHEFFLNLVLIKNANSDQNTFIHCLFANGVEEKVVDFIFTQFLANAAGIDVLNKLCLQKNGAGDIFLKNIFRQSYTEKIYKQILNNLTDTTLQSLLLLQDANKNNLLQYVANSYSLEMIALTLQKAQMLDSKSNLTISSTMVSHFSNDYPSIIIFYLQAIAVHYKELSSNSYSKKLITDYLNLILKILTEIKIVNGHLKHGSYYPFMFEVLFSLRYAVTKYDSPDNDNYWFDQSDYKGINPQMSVSLTGLIRRTVVALFENISFDDFVKTIDNLSVETFWTGIYDKRNPLMAAEAFKSLLNKLHYFPYKFIDPYKVLHAITFTALGIPDYAFSSQYYLHFDYTSQYRKFENYIRDPKRMVLSEPEEFAKFYTNVMRYQYLKLGKFNQVYLKILSSAIEAIDINEDSVSDVNKKIKLRDCKLQLLNIVTYLKSLTNEADPRKIAKLITHEGMTPAEYSAYYQVSQSAALELADDDINKLKLELNAVNFLYEGAKLMLAQKISNVLRENNLIIALNTRLNIGLGFAANAIKETEIDEANYLLLIEKIIKNYEKINYKNWEKHLGMFKDYLDRRHHTLRYGIFNNEDDYHYRKAYLDSLKAVEGQLQAMKDIIDRVLCDVNLTKGLSRECLNICKLLRVDIEDMFFLQKIKDKIPQLNNPFVPPYAQLNN